MTDRRPGVNNEVEVAGQPENIHLPDVLLKGPVHSGLLTWSYLGPQHNDLNRRGVLRIWVKDLPEYARKWFLEVFGAPDPRAARHPQDMGMRKQARRWLRDLKQLLAHSCSGAKHVHVSKSDNLRMR